MLHAEQPKSAPSSKKYSTYDNDESDEEEDWYSSQLSDVTMKLNMTFDEQANKFDPTFWSQRAPVLFDLYDHVGKSSTALNYVEGELLDSDGHLIDLDYKRILLIPVLNDNTTVIFVPEPEIQSADLYLL